jgi:hypothetical protein
MEESKVTHRVGPRAAAGDDLELDGLLDGFGVDVALPKNDGVR